MDLKRAPSVCFIAAGMDKIEVKNQQIQTEIVKTVEQHVQAGSTAKQQGVYSYHCATFLFVICDCGNKGIRMKRQKY